MTPLKVNVLIAQFCYAGNGGVAAVLPELATWLAETSMTIQKDERVEKAMVKRYGDVPLTMERNRVVVDAYEQGFDIIVMLDSDNLPDLYLKRKSWAQPFWKSSFDFAYERLLRGIPSVVCSPYCGPPPHPVHGGEENVYVFYAANRATDLSNPSYHFVGYSRNEAARMRGIQECIAGPTGVILYTRSAFDLLQFDRRPIAKILVDYKSGLMSLDQCARAIQMKSWFWYEFKDQTQSRKCSTEDVTNTREIGMAGQMKFGEAVLFCNWDAWAGHMKPLCVGMPEPVLVDQVSAIYQQAVLDNQQLGVELREVDFTKSDRFLQQKIDRLHEELESVPPRDAITDAIDADDVVPTQDIRKNGDTAGRGTGVEIKARMICGRKCYSVGHVTPDDHLNCLTMLAKHMGTLVKNRPLRMLEVGSWVGESAVALLGGAPAGSEIFCVDTWEGSPSDWTHQLAKLEPVFDYFLKNVGDLVGRTVKPLKGESVEVANSFDDNQQLDLIFIDADHEYESVMADLLSWRRHLAQGGVLCGHDYGCPQFPDVKRAVDDFCVSLGTHATQIENTSIWFCGFHAFRQPVPETEVLPNVGGAAHSRSLGG